MSFTFEEAEKSASEWFGKDKSPMKKWFIEAILNKEKHRDIGKVLAYGAEEYVIQWLRDRTFRQMDTVTGESYDGITIDDEKLVRILFLWKSLGHLLANGIQIKFRMDEWTLSTTRSSKESSTAYKSDEFDLLVILKPGYAFGLTDAKVRCIPVSALINPEKPNELVKKINAATRKIYDNDDKTIEVLNKVFHPPNET